MELRVINTEIYEQKRLVDAWTHAIDQTYKTKPKRYKKSKKHTPSRKNTQ